MTTPVAWGIDSLVTAFERHLRRTRGTSDRTLRGYSRYVRLFLRSVFDDGHVDPGRLDTPDVIGFVAAAAARYRPSTVKLLATSLRAFFRFLVAQGLAGGTLLKAVPKAAHWRLAGLPRGLSEEHYDRMIRSLDGSTALARRDRAMVLCLCMLGLRGAEVAELCLDDIEWRAGTVRIRRRKTGRGAVLPLPDDLGRAIVAYLRRGRPPTSDRHVFVLHGGSIGKPIRSHVVAQAVGRALDRAGLAAPSRGTHLLRHTLATRMLRHGASLEEVGDVLGHRHLDTTAIYAKVDLSALGDVALPWPGAAS